VVLALLAVVVLVTGVAAATLLGGDEDGDGGGSTAAPPSTTAPPAPEQSTTPPTVDDDEGGSQGGAGSSGSRSALEATVAELSDHVATVRGAPFPEPVTVELLDDDAFAERLLEDFEEERADLDLTGRLFVALQLLEPDEDLFELYEDFLGEGVVGFYDPETGALVVRGAEITTYTRSTIVHELVHAYDDQRFELHRPDLQEADDESGLGFAALVEGNAVRVQQRWEAMLSDDEQAELLLEQLAAAGDLDIGGIPTVLLRQIEFPYTDGAMLVEALVEDGGEDRVDAAYAAPPTTSEQVSEPDAYLAGEGAAPVPPPPADGEIVDQGSFGQLTLTLTLASAVDRQTAREAADGWGGDAYVAWDEEDRTCVRTAFRMDTPADLDELADAWEAWSEEHGDATVVSDDTTVTVTACG
jgi:hypothetical protein